MTIPKKRILKHDTSEKGTHWKMTIRTNWKGQPRKGTKLKKDNSDKGKLKLQFWKGKEWKKLHRERKTTEQGQILKGKNSNNGNNSEKGQSEKDNSENQESDIDNYEKDQSGKGQV